MPSANAAASTLNNTTGMFGPSARLPGGLAVDVLPAGNVVAGFRLGVAVEWVEVVLQTLQSQTASPTYNGQFKLCLVGQQKVASKAVPEISTADLGIVNDLRAEHLLKE